MLPKLTPATDLGEAGVAGYAERQELDIATFLQNFGPTLMPDQVGTALLTLDTDPQLDQDAYLLTPAGLTSLG